MWIKLDDGFATHPKILAAGFIAMGIQLRAICYASQNKTDGFIHANAIPLLLIGLERVGIAYASIGDGTGGQLAGLGLDADDIDWPAELVKYGLWEPRADGYYIHDYLKWNLSKKQYESIKSKLSKAGRKGMKSRWKHDNQGHNPPNNKTITSPSTSTATATATLSSLNSPNPEGKIPVKKRGNGLSEFPAAWKLSDDEKARAHALGLNPLHEFAKFRDHHQAKGTKFKDWPAAWRNWVRRGLEMKEAR